MFHLLWCWLLALICFHTSDSIDISADTIQRLKKGEWVIYPHGDDEERVVKIVNFSSILDNKEISYEDAERYCTKEDGHLFIFPTATVTVFVVHNAHPPPSRGYMMVVTAKMATLSKSIGVFYPADVITFLAGLGKHLKMTTDLYGEYYNVIFTGFVSEYKVVGADGTEANEYVKGMWPFKYFLEKFRRERTCFAINAHHNGTFTYDVWSCDRMEPRYYYYVACEKRNQNETQFFEIKIDLF
ncbi:hypothetical protein TELCIR_00499 [Teladorsagia circumcincta]|uniref:Lectin C-type domain protein n=1 Tax=Teladorsagia circumcincta TaxID=45464 RepID=A0A2G9V5X4_TELCI|nr:hypothetical protein TELCIR_00499 [Teladorsagia circumcincta]